MKKILYGLLLLSIAFAAGCDGNLLDATKGESQPTAWDQTNEPKIAESSSTSYTVSWTQLANAVSYEIYIVTAWNPVQMTYNTSVTGNSVTITDYTQQYCVVAKNANGTEIGRRYFSGWGSVNIAGKTFLSGTFIDVFADGVFNDSYWLRNSSQASEASGYMQLNQNITNNGPLFFIPYDTQGYRYISITCKDYHYRANNYYGGDLQISSYTNNIGSISLFTSIHSADSGYYGVYLRYQNRTSDYEYQADVYTQLSSTERFDQWFNVQYVIDTHTSSVKLYINGSQEGSEVTISNMPKLESKVIIQFNPLGWYTGHYRRIDDLEIQSSDSLGDFGL